jgi:hypothetical protein
MIRDNEERKKWQEFCGAKDLLREKGLKGQGSTEYLVIFAAVLVVALLVIFLLANFSGFGVQSLIDQSRSYWRSQVPLSIDDYSAVLGAPNNITLRINNKDIKKINLTNITFDGVGPQAGITTAGVLINPGQTVTLNINFTAPVAPICAATDSGQLKEYRVALIYRIPPDTATAYSIVGTVPLRIVCP